MYPVRQCFCLRALDSVKRIASPSKSAIKVTACGFDPDKKAFHVGSPCSDGFL
jgi:hypothetical protein